MNSIKTYGMAERADYFDFDIRAQQVREPVSYTHLTLPTTPYV